MNLPLSADEIVYALAVIALFAGWFLALAPHAYHARAGLESQPHEEHVGEGIVLVVTGLAVLFLNARQKTENARVKNSAKRRG